MEYDRILEDDPDHLRARCQRAVAILPTDPDAAIAEFVALIEHPRFEELFREQPTAIRIFQHVAIDLVRRGRVAKALDVAQRGLDHANRSRSLADETVKARSRSGNQSPLWPKDESHFLIARIHAIAARNDPRELDQAVSHLERTFDRYPKSRDVWIANNRDFDGFRDEILKRIGSSTAGR